MAASLSMLPHIRRLIDPSALDLGGDAALLDLYVRHGDQTAFAVLVARHGPMVLRVCRRVLGEAHAAEDACQAAFLVLARKAAGIRHAETLAAWLHGVAYRLALKARAVEARRRQAETRSLQSAPSSPVDPLTEVSGRELLTILDAELQHLPERYRLPLILCCLEGRSQPEAARLLGWTPGSVKGRLERGRAKLHQRLLRRGLTLPAALLALEAAQGAATARMPATLTTSIVQAISGGASTGVAALAEGGIAGMVGMKTKLVFLLVLTFGTVTAGVGVLAQSGLVARPAEEKPTAQPNADPPKAALPKPAKEQARTDRYGDPLPPNALLRLGTVRLRHGAPVTSLAFLPGGKDLLSGSFDGTIRLWEGATGRELRKVTAGQGLIRRVVLSPDGKTLASANNDSVVSLWDVATGKEILRLGPFHSAIPSIAFGPDGKSLAGALTGQKKVQLWEVPSGQVLSTLRLPEAVSEIALSSDGRTLATGAFSDPTIRLWDIGSEKELHKLEGHAGSITALAFSPDGETLASAGSRDRSILLWEVATGKQLRRLSRQRGIAGADAVAFSPDGKVVAAGFRGDSPTDDTIGIWDPVLGKELRWIKGHSFGVNCLTFSDDGKILATGSNDCAVQLWDVATGKELHHFEGHKGRLLTLTYSPNGETLATGSMDGTVCLWDPSTGKLCGKFDGQGKWVYRAAFSPDGKILATVHSDQMVRLWEVATGKEVRRFVGYSYSGAYYGGSLIFSPDGETLATMGKDGVICLWDVATGKKLRQFPGHGKYAVLAFLPDGKTLVSASGDGQTPTSTVRLQDAASGNVIRHWVTPQRIVETIAVSPDGRFLAVGGMDEGVRVWETTTEKERREFQWPTADDASSSAFSPDGRTLAVAFGSGQIGLWEVATGKERRRFDGHQSISLSSVAFAPDGRTLASAGGDSATLVWDVTGRSPAAQSGSLSVERLQALWDDLASKDAGKAFDAIGLLTATPGMAVSLLKEKLRPAPAPAERQQVARLIADLDDEQFAVRQKAREELRRLDERAESGLQEALKGKLPLEARKRIEELLEGVRDLAASPEKLRAFRTVEVLEHIGTPAARDVLKTLADGAPEARLTREAKASLERLAKRR